jgi:serine phosphatase RsbU (regulator of sigma subunit)
MITKRYSGGGKGGTKETVPAWVVPYLQKVGDEANTLYGSGELSKVADVNENLSRTFGASADRIESTTAQGISALDESQARMVQLAQSGGYDTTAMKEKAILEAGMKTADLGKQYGAAGTLGSARQAVQQGAQNAATAAEFADIDYKVAQQMFENKMTAEQGIGSAASGKTNLASGAAEASGAIGMAERGITQEQLDAPWQGLERFGQTVYGNPARQQQSGGSK